MGRKNAWALEVSTRIPLVRACQGFWSRHTKGADDAADGRRAAAVHAEDKDDLSLRRRCRLALRGGPLRPWLAPRVIVHSNNPRFLTKSFKPPPLKQELPPACRAVVAKLHGSILETYTNKSSSRKVAKNAPLWATPSTPNSACIRTQSPETGPVGARRLFASRSLPASPRCARSYRCSCSTAAAGRLRHIQPLDHRSGP